MPVQRLRLTFRKGERVRFISHLDVMRYWERCIRRAELPLSYSQGFTPHPKLQFAGPLPLGFVSEGELVDVTLDERVPIAEFVERLSAQTSADLSVVRVDEVPLTGAPPQATAVWAEYSVRLDDVPIEAAREAVAAFLATDRVPFLDDRREKPRTIDLRDITPSLSATAAGCGSLLHARMRASQEHAGRPEMLVAALFPGHEPSLVSRLTISLDEPSPAHDLWRRRGRFED